MPYCTVLYGDGNTGKLWMGFVDLVSHATMQACASSATLHCRRRLCHPSAAAAAAAPPPLQRRSNTIMSQEYELKLKDCNYVYVQEA